jgi:hypothetical protein
MYIQSFKIHAAKWIEKLGKIGKSKISISNFSMPPLKTARMRTEKNNKI